MKLSMLKPIRLVWVSETSNMLTGTSIFLSKRTSTDIIRNAIVSVFLRSLEYYSGILFLTTNRIGIIDRAFKSRIHLTLYYPSLDQTSTRQIWQNNICRLKKELVQDGKTIGQDVLLDENSIMKFAHKHFRELKQENFLPWNGRQIRNAFQTAVAIANYEAKTKTPPWPLVLDDRQFEKVAKSAKLFDRYLRKVSKGKTDADLAASESVRIDGCDSSGMMKDHAIEPIRSSPWRATQDAVHSPEWRYESVCELDCDMKNKKRNRPSSSDMDGAESPIQTKKTKHDPLALR